MFCQAVRIARWRERWPVLAGYLLALAIAVGLSVLIFRQTRNEADADRLEGHTYQVILELERLLSDVKDVQGSMRGYVITGEERYLEPYRTVLGTVDQRLDSLRELTRDNPRQQQRLEVIERLMADRLASSKEAIDLRQTQGEEAAAKFVATGRGKAVTDELRRQIAAAIKEEEGLLSERTAVKKADRDKLLMAVIIGGLFSFALLGVLLLYVGRGSAEATRADRSMLSRYGVAIGIIVVAVFALILLRPLFEGHSPPLVLLTLAVAAAAWWGGLGPGLVATALGVLLTWLAPHGPYYHLDAPDAAEATRMLLTVFSGASISALAEGMHRALDRQRTNASRLAVEVQERRLVHDQLVTAQEKLRLTMQAARMGNFEWNIATGSLHWSPELEAIFGLEPGAFGGTYEDWKNLVHPEDRDEAMRQALRALGEEVLKVEHRVVWPDGTVRWLAATGTVSRETSGNARTVLGMVIDITEVRAAREILREGQQRLQAIFDNAGVGMVEVSDDDRLIAVNDKVCRILGYRRDELLGKTVHALTHPEDRRRSDELNAQLHEGRFERLDYEKRYLKRDGLSLWVHATVSPIRDAVGKWLRSITTIEDIGDRKKAEAELAAARAAAEQAKLAAEQANLAKSQFLANMSHELRTPMNAVMGMTELALQEDLAPIVRDTLQTAKDSADTLLTLINEILDLSRIEAGMLVLESAPFRLRALLDSAMRAIAVRAYEKGLELACDVSPEVPDRLIGDPLRLRQIVTNLVGNAIKFTHDGEIVVHVDLDEADGEAVRLRFAVVDTGIGIPPEHQEKIFAPFTQADASTVRRFGGTGLGLSIVASLVEILGGRMWLESEVGQGSTFYFTVQSERQPGPEPVEPQQLVLEQLKDLPVLIADDNATTRRVLQRILSGWSMRPTFAEDGPSVLARLREAARAGHPPHLVIADAFLPGSEGHRLVEEIRKDPSIKAVVILMASPPDKQRLIRDAGSSNGFVYLEKPISESAVSCAVSQAMGLSLCPDLLLAQTPCETKSAARRLRILLAEDTPANQKLAIRILTKRGHAVTTVENGQEAVDRLASEDFDVVLMDVQMPVMDGFQATAEIRRLLPEKARVPVIAMTAHALRGDQERCLAAGMDAYISKPINAQELIALVENVPQHA